MIHFLLPEHMKPIFFLCYDVSAVSPELHAEDLTNDALVLV